MRPSLLAVSGGWLAIETATCKPPASNREGAQIQMQGTARRHREPREIHCCIRWEVHGAAPELKVLFAAWYPEVFIRQICLIGALVKAPSACNDSVGSPF